jgi:hypothetical protein
MMQITRGLLQKHGAERVRDTPITEVSCYSISNKQLNSDPLPGAWSLQLHMNNKPAVSWG